MDSVSDKDIESIWSRLQKYIDVKQLKSKSKEGLKNEINTQLRGVSSSDKSGSVQTLLEHGFADRVLKNENVKKDLGFEEERIIGGGGVPKPIPAVKTYGVSLKLPPIVTTRDFGKVGVVVRGRTRVYNGANIVILNSYWRGREAFYITNSRTGKRVTWGLYE
jgi:hypothetical protein